MLMLDSVYCMEGLFNQLGLPSDKASITQFITDHQLAENTKLTEASFWTPSQARFLCEGLAQNAEWAIVIDELNAQLHSNYF
ncbi:DUF2789 domain-containing protein [Thiofilum flexile]|uniref:DUF2789 domain-containing protein n=1 Tax=Thiofilum flexile TaxID=125627 RepID=UPI00037CA107|nr:DUF2789 domain-containing protein [Thiofilum flexile]